MSDNPFIKAKKQFTLPGTGKGKPTGNTLLQKARDLQCPYWTILTYSVPGEPLEPVGALLVLLDDQPTAIDADIMRPVIASLAARQAVVVMAKTRAVREHARSEIMGWAGQARGTA